MKAEEVAKRRGKKKKERGCPREKKPFPSRG
jgi:hypothetical protein